MKKLNLLGSFGLSILASLTIYLPAFVAYPWNSANAQSQRTIGQTPQELGSQYPELVRRARQAVSTLPSNTPLQFPLGVNSPIRLHDSWYNQPLQPSSGKRYQAIGFVNSSGQPQAITVADLLEMFDYHLEAFETANLPMFPIAEQVLVADASDNYVVAQVGDVLNLIVVDTQTNKVQLAPNILFVGFLRDATNAALNNEFSSSNFDVTQLDMSGIRDQLLRYPRAPL